MILKAADTHNFLGSESSSSDKMEEEDSSQKAQPPTSPLQVRLESIKGDLMQLLHLDWSVPRTQDEEKQLKEWVRLNIGWLGSVIGIFDVSIGWVAKKARESKLLQCGVQAVSSLGAELRHTLDPGAAPSESEIFNKFPELRQNLPSLEHFLIIPWMGVLNEISSKMHEGESYDDIITNLCNKYDIPNKKLEFKAYIKALLLRVELEYIIRRGGDCSVQPNIVVFTKDGAQYQAPVLTLSLPEKFMKNSDGVVIPKLEIPIECLKDPVIVPAKLSQAIKSSKKAAEAAAEAAASAASEVAQFTKNNTNKFIQWIGNVCTSSEPMGTSGAIGIEVEDPLSGIREELQKAVVVAEAEVDTEKSTPSEKQTQIVIKSCCEKAPGILEQLVKQTDIVGAAALVDLQPENDDGGAIDALQKLLDVEPADMEEENQQTDIVGAAALVDLQPENDDGGANDALQKLLDVKPADKEEENQQTDNNHHKEERLNTRDRSPHGSIESNDMSSSGGGKSRTRRRRPATAKRTRRKAYNKKSNKRKSSKKLSRKKISRMRQSRRK
jgi:hypothetical protein